MYVCGEGGGAAFVHRPLLVHCGRLPGAVLCRSVVTLEAQIVPEPVSGFWTDVRSCGVCKSDVLCPQVKH